MSLFGTHGPGGPESPGRLSSEGEAGPESWAPQPTLWLGRCRTGRHAGAPGSTLPPIPLPLSVLFFPILVAKLQFRRPSGLVGWFLFLLPRQLPLGSFPLAAGSPCPCPGPPLPLPWWWGGTLGSAGAALGSEGRCDEMPPQQKLCSMVCRCLCLPVKFYWNTATVPLTYCFSPGVQWIADPEMRTPRPFTETCAE